MQTAVYIRWELFHFSQSSLDPVFNVRSDSIASPRSALGRFRQWQQHVSAIPGLYEPETIQAR